MATREREAGEHHEGRYDFLMQYPVEVRRDVLDVIWKWQARVNREVESLSQAIRAGEPTGL
jgi:hypothetical protein